MTLRLNAKTAPNTTQVSMAPPAVASLSSSRYPLAVPWGPPSVLISSERVMDSFVTSP